MTYTLTREDPKADLKAIKEWLDPSGRTPSKEAWEFLVDVRNSLQEQAKVEEPREFGTVIAATRGRTRMHWQPAEDVGDHYWRSSTNAVEVWSELTDVEVLRVGLGADPEAAEIAQEAFRDGVREGRRAMNVSFHLRLREQLDEAIGAERKNAIERMIAVVEELAS